MVTTASWADGEIETVGDPFSREPSDGVGDSLD